MPIGGPFDATPWAGQIPGTGLYGGEPRAMSELARREYQQWRQGNMADILGFPHGDRPGDVYQPAPNENPNVVDPPKLTPEEEFHALLCNLAQIGLAIAKNKNADYAGNGDPFANFRTSESVGVSVPRGILVRMMDKLSRVSNLITRPPAVANESLMDTCIDLSNYALILAAYFKTHPNSAE